MRARLVSVVAAVAAAAWSVAAAADTVVKVGLISTYSGSEAQAGEQIDKGARLYAAEHAKDLPPGVHIEIVARDDTGPNPDVAKRVAQELITRDHVQFLTGVVWTPNAAAIAPLTAEAKVPFVIANAAGVTLTRISPYVVRVSYTLPQLVTPLGQWAAKQGWKTGYTAVPDFSPGHESEAAFIKAFTAAGGKMVGQVSYPVVNPDFAPFIARLKDVKPDVAYIFCIAGKQSTALIKTLADLGVMSAGIHPVGQFDLTSDDELANMGEAALGIATASSYSPSAKRPANQAFIAAWRRAYGPGAITPNLFAASAWDAMAAIFDTVAATKGRGTADEAMAFLSHWKNPASPRGPIAIDPATRDVIENVYIRRVEKVDGRLANVEFETYAQVKDPWKEANPAK